jgi:alpha-ketoglutarate-dependent taurine dioxygenase
MIQIIRPTRAISAETARSILDSPELYVDLDFQPGRIQYVNNRSTGHARTEFRDDDEPERKRHLVRMWLRDHGRRGYRG